MKKIVICCFVILSTTFTVRAQTTQKNEYFEQVWFTYLNQLRFSDKWELWTDVNLRTKDDFANNFSMTLFRIGLTYYLSPNTKISAGYVWAEYFPAPNHKNVSFPEHRPWQQILWNTKYGKTTMRQGIRLEERFRHKILNDDSLAAGYNFNCRIRYNLLFEIPVSKKVNEPGALSFIISDEVMFNFGKQIVNNYFDQNRFYLGLKFQTGTFTNIQLGYLNIFQPLVQANQNLRGNVIRLTCVQNIDLHQKK